MAHWQEIFFKRSANHSLAEEAELEAEDKYFEKLEKKEAMEEKMLATRYFEDKIGVQSSKRNFVLKEWIFKFILTIH